MMKVTCCVEVNQIVSTKQFESEKSKLFVSRYSSLSGIYKL